MADYSIIADTSNALLRVLRENMCPEPIQSPESISLATPVDKNGDFQLGVFLHDMKDLSEYRESTPQRGAGHVMTFPSRPLTLFYLLFLNNKAQISAGAEMEQRIFGKAYQVLMDNSVLDISSVNPFVEEGEQETRISILSPGFEEKSKIWSALSVPYQLAVYLSVAPISISSRREQVFTRVVSSRFSTQIMDDGNMGGARNPSWSPKKEGDV